MLFLNKQGVRMQSSGLSERLPTISNRVEVNNSCNCCCFPRRRAKRIDPSEIKVERVIAKVQDVSDFLKRTDSR